MKRKIAPMTMRLAAASCALACAALLVHLDGRLYFGVTWCLLAIAAMCAFTAYTNRLAA